MLQNKKKPLKCGEIYWSKLKGYPWWPAMISREEHGSNKFIRVRVRNITEYFVQFFGTRYEYAWVTENSMCKFKHTDTKQYMETVKGSKKYKDILDQAIDEANIYLNESEEEKGIYFYKKYKKDQQNKIAKSIHFFNLYAIIFS